MYTLLIGEGSLFVSCFHQLKQAGYHVSAIISPDEHVRELCKDQKIPYFSDPETFTKYYDLNLYRIDYLWSINNNWVLKPNLIECARTLAINFHNAPLPHYRGRNSVAWAIYHDESHHGITWHQLTSDIDAGPILLNEDFPIPQQSSSATLNLLCCERAIKTLPKLLKQLAHSTLSPQPQDKNISRYYGLKKPIDTVIDWKNTGAQIVRLARTLNFGPFLNTMGLIQFFCRDNVFFPIDINCITEPNISKKDPPGTILKINEEMMVVSTSQDKLSIRAIRDRYGNDFSPKAFCQAQKLTIGDQLTHLSPYIRQAFMSKRSGSVIHETFWQKYWKASYDLLTLPFQPAFQEISDETSDRKTMSCPLLSQRLHTNYELAALCLIFLARLTRRYTFTIGMRYDTDIPQCIQTFWTDSLPYSVKIDPDEKLSACTEKIVNSLLSLPSKSTYPVDFIHRIANAYSKKIHTTNFPIIINLCEDKKVQCFPQSCILHIQPNTIQLEYDKDTSVQFTHYIPVLLRYLKYFLKHSQPEQAVSMLPLLSLKEEQQLLLYNRSYQKPYPKNMLVHQLFEDQVDRTPNAIALKFNEDKMTYQQLDQQANRLAHQLKSRLEIENAMVALCCSRSAETIIGLLAILKAGGAYVPVDEALPEQRLSYMLNHIKPQIILTSSNPLSQRLRRLANTSTAIITLDTNHTKTDSLTTDRPEIKKTSDSLAYVIYTSGTTGQPKGVMMEHHSLVNRLNWMHQKYPLKSGNYFLQKTPLTFDWSFTETLLPLVSGACLILDTTYAYKDPERLHKMIQSDTITDIHFVPSMLHAFVDYMDSHNSTRLKNIQRLYMSGEALCSYLLKKAKCHFPFAQIYNLYGPTEAGEVSYCLYQPKQHRDGSVPIGMPIDNSEMFILNNQKRPVPVGAVGDLYLGGTTLARGYLHDIQLTKQRFIDNPFKKLGLSKKLYKTGDLARWLPNGKIDFLGRSDSQVKLRGVRIELEEIEHIICQHPYVKRAIAQVFQQHIVAYLIISNKNSKQEVIAAVRAHTRSYLPDIMVPAAFIPIDHVPTTSHGKKDLRNLPKPLRQDYTMFSEEQPQKIQKKHLIEIWKQLLGLPSVGIQDDFFTIGGSSITLIQLLTEVKRHYGRTVPVSEFLNSPTIDYLDQWLSNKSTRYFNKRLSKIPYQVKQDIESSRQMLQEYAINTNSIAKESLKTQSNHVFITGITGFLGIHLLAKIAQQARIKAYCLVRAKNKDSALKKLEQTAHYYNLKISKNANIQILCGDLCLPYLGLDKDTFYKLSQTVDAVYHIAAQVNHILSYSSLRQCNVLSTQTILKLVAQAKKKSLYYVSSLGTTNSEQETLLSDQSWHKGLVNGYLQTKWASEVMIKQAIDQGLIAYIFRPSWIVPSSSQRKIQLPYNDHLVHLIQGCLDLGYFPNWTLKLNLISVDWVSDMLFHLTQQEKHDHVFHLAHPNSVTWKLLVNYIQYICPSIQVIDPELWCTKVAQLTHNQTLYPLASLYQTAKTAFLPNTNALNCQHMKWQNYKDITHPHTIQSLLTQYIRGFKFKHQPQHIS